MGTRQASFADTQPAGLWLKLLFAAMLLLCFALVGPATGAAASIGAASFILVVVFRSLTVEVDHEAVSLRYGSGWPRRSVPLSRIVEQRAVRNRWWYGFGIRLTPHGWLWNLDGLDAVELELEGGKRFRVGTRVPLELCEAIAAARSGAGRP